MSRSMSEYRCYLVVQRQSLLIRVSAFVSCCNTDSMVGLTKRLSGISTTRANKADSPKRLKHIR